tara:strand:+ start:788 stop:961 length:174 start_codon:yes stop_codon:yes gene_type:complete
MPKNMLEAIEDNVSFDIAEHHVVVWIDGTYHYRPAAWPLSGHGSAPTLAQVQVWMAA